MSNLGVKVSELVLRCVIFGFAFISVVLIATDTQTKDIFVVQKKARFTDMKSLVFLVVVNGVAAAHSLVQVGRCVVFMVKGRAVFSKPLAWAIFSGDQVISYLALVAVAIAVQSSAFAKFGQRELQWMIICNMYEKFCNQIGVGITSALFVSICMLFMSCISAFNLFRLYNEKRRYNDSK